MDHATLLLPTDHPHPYSICHPLANCSTGHMRRLEDTGFLILGCLMVIYKLWGDFRWAFVFFSSRLPNIKFLKLSAHGVLLAYYLTSLFQFTVNLEEVYLDCKNSHMASYWVTVHGDLLFSPIYIFYLCNNVLIDVLLFISSFSFFFVSVCFLAQSPKSKSHLLLSVPQFFLKAVKKQLSFPGFQW